jgi:hypothetical protein
VKICDPCESAFPSETPYELRDRQGHLSLVEHRWGGGLSKREYFAGLALQGILASHQMIVSDDKDKLGAVCCEYADALIDALNKEAME